MPVIWSGPSVSSSRHHPMSAVSGGASDIKSTGSRGPRMTSARKRQRSPSVKPTSPESESHSHACELASRGRAMPRVKNVSARSMASAMTKRSRLTTKDPMCRPAVAKNQAVIVHDTAVPMA